MSRIGKRPVILPEGVNVSILPNAVSVSGKLGTLKVPLLPHVKVEERDRKLFVTTLDSGKQAAANWGTMRAHLQNAVLGVTEGFTKVLEIEGIGYRAAIEGKNISLSLGYSHPIHFEIPQGISATVEKSTIIKLSGIDKELVGQTAARLRALKKPEPYKGKGIRYAGEVIRRKAGKKVAGATS
jgi:large subunit ribosomal protein L6